jgi:hypothetical protein
MKATTTKTKVLFLIETTEDITGQIFAYFPCEHYYSKGHLQHREMFTSYAHIGQHSACHISYANECKQATKSQYQALYNELESIGYDLKVLNK